MTGKIQESAGRMIEGAAEGRGTGTELAAGAAAGRVELNIVEEGAFGAENALVPRPNLRIVVQGHGEAVPEFSKRVVHRLQRERPARIHYFLAERFDVGIRLERAELAKRLFSALQRGFESEPRELVLHVASGGRMQLEGFSLLDELRHPSLTEDQTQEAIPTPSVSLLGTRCPVELSLRCNDSTKLDSGVFFSSPRLEPEDNETDGQTRWSEDLGNAGSAAAGVAETAPDRNDRSVRRASGWPIAS